MRLPLVTTIEEVDHVDADEVFNMFPKGADALILKLVAPEVFGPLEAHELRTVLQSLKAIGHRQ